MIEGILMRLFGFGFHCPVRLMFIGIAAVMLITVAAPLASLGHAQPIAYSNDFNDGRTEGWQLDSNWQPRENRLVARGPGWARYRNGTWEDLVLSFLFDTSGKGLQANIRISDRGRYGVAFVPQRGFLAVYLFKELVAAGPNSFRELAKKRIPVRGVSRGFRTEISAKGDSLTVSVNGKLALSARDSEPLPAGFIAFETPKEGQAFVDDVAVRAERPSLKVPALIGKPIAEARSLLADLRLAIGQTRERPSDLKEGLVVDQHPAEGTRAAQGTAVDLVVSTGRQQVEVPRLTGARRGEALRMIRDAGLKVGGIRQADSARDDVIVIDQEPGPGARVLSGTPVSITVAGSTLIEVPRVIDKSLKAAREAIEGARLAVGEVVRKPSDSAPENVFEQNPKPGSRVPSGSQVQLWVSSGPAADAGSVEVPKVIGRKREEAGPILSRASLEVGKVYEQVSSLEPGTVIEQDPAPNARTRSRSSVDLWVAISAPPSSRGGGGGWIFPAVVTGLLGILAGFLGSKALGSRRVSSRRPVSQITVRVLGGSGEQAMETTASGPDLPVLRCRVLRDAGIQRINVSGTTSAEEEDTHVGRPDNIG